LSRLRARCEPGLAILVIVSLAACQGGDLGPGVDPGPPAALEILSGPGQSGQVGRALEGAVVARVTDADGRGVPGIAITFATGSGMLSPATGTTDGEGEALAAWTLGTRSGPVTATVTAEGLPPVTVPVTALPGAPARLGFATAPASAVAGIAFDPAVTVAITDEFDNRVPHAAEIELELNHGDLSGTTSTVAVDGLATFPDLVIAAAGTDYVLAAHAAGLAAAETQAFAVAARAGSVDPGRSTIEVAPATVTLGAPSVVTVTARDAFGDPVQGAQVVLSATGADHSIVQPAPTGANGAATGTFGAASAGRRTISAAVGGVTWEQTAGVVVEGPPEVVEVTVSPGQASLLMEQTVQLSAVARDEGGDPVPGATVAWSSADPDVATVDADGRVTAMAPGTATITAASAGRSGTAEVAVSLGGGTLTDVTYCTVDGTDVRMDVYLPDASKPRPLPVAVHVHGGGWISGSKSSGSRFNELKPMLLDRGYLVVSLDYRLAPEHRYPAQIQDVKCAIRHLRARAWRYGLDPDRIGAWGGSAGGQLVSLLGTAGASAGFDDAGGFQGQSSAVQAVVAISAITDFTHPDELLDDYRRAFRTWPDPASPEMIEASPVTHVSPGDAPFLFIVADEDELVMPAQSERMRQLLEDAGVPASLLRVLHANHALEPTDAPLDPSPAVINSRMADFFDQHLR
jgi:acetyl esterase/lipase